MSPPLSPSDGARRDVQGLLERLADDSGSGAEPASLQSAVDELTTILYEDLRRLASAYIARERPGNSLSPTDLVHEAYGRLIDQDRVSWQGRTHFLGIAAQAMRRILVDHARKRLTDKRGGTWRRVALEGVGSAGSTEALDHARLLALDRALDRLGELDARQARVVEMRYFAGMSIPEVAAVLDVAPRTVDRDWTHARSWLKRELAQGGA